jgi:hypothetical protein
MRDVHSQSIIFAYGRDCHAGHVASIRVGAEDEGTLFVGPAAVVKEVALVVHTSEWIQT